jgi:phosphoadenosine phosphosulfate reductase
LRAAFSSGAGQPLSLLLGEQISKESINMTGMTFDRRRDGHIAFGATGSLEAAKCDELNRAASGADIDRDLMKRLAMVRGLTDGRLVFTTSFGIEDQAIAHALFAQDLEIEVVTLDTGRLFPQTYELWAQTERLYGRRIRAFYPDRQSVESLVARQGIDGFYASVDARRTCCAVRKVEPLERALADAAAWITGLRMDQSEERAGSSFAAGDPHHRLIKISPLFDWTREQVFSFIRQRRVPYNSLHHCGFASIGCAPCTRAIAPGESERAGRWWWEREEKKECGLHRHRRPAPPVRTERGRTTEEATR